jgi:uncharacterized protein (DUF736 family)
MLNAVGHVTKQADGRYWGQLRTVNIRVDIDILPSVQKTADSQLDFHLMTEDIEIEAGWPAKANPPTREM